MTRGGYNDPDCDGNGPEYWTWQPCIENGCVLSAGTVWSQYWCFEHNVERIDRIRRQLDGLRAELALRATS